MKVSKKGEDIVINIDDEREEGGCIIRMTKEQAKSLIAMLIKEVKDAA